jgi:hypothetical protein
MKNTEIAQRFASLENKMSVDEYNFEHFRTKHLLSDAKATFEERGIKPGEMAPDFELPQVGGGGLRLSELRGRPIVLHFGSFS